MITNLRKTPIVGGDTFLMEWGSTLPDPVTFYIYLNGRLVDVTTRASYVVAPVPKENVHFFVEDDINVIPVLGYPGFFVIPFDAVEGAKFYRVSQFIDDAFVPLVDIKEDGSQSYTYQTQHLDDDTTYRFLITPFSGETGDSLNVGNDGTPFEITALMVRRPDAQNNEDSYDGGTGVHTITQVAEVTIGGAGGGT